MADYTLTAKLTADTKGLKKGFQQAQDALANVQSKTSEFGKGLKSLGNRISGLGDTLTKRLTLPALGAASALTGITLVKGFNRLTGIDTAQAKLKGLGHDAQAVEEIMNSALDSVRGTAFGMDEAATTAANAVAAGIPLGEELTRYLTITGDAAAIAGASMAEMGSIINKVTTAGKAYNGELQQLSDRGLPIYQWLAEEANTTADAIFDMASQGEISTDMFLRAIENNIGGAAKAMGEESFMAGIANIGAAVSRLGANFLDAGGEAGGFFSTIKPLIPEVIGYIDSLADKAADLGARLGEAFNSFIDRIRDLKSWFDGLDPAMQNTILKAVGIGSAFLVGIGPALGLIGRITSGVGTLVSVFSLLFSPIGLVVGAILGLGIAFGTAMIKSEDFRAKVFGVFEKIQEIASNVISFLSPILSKMWDKAKTGVASFADSLGGRLLNAFEIISDVVMTVVEVIGGFVSSLIGGFQDAGGEVSNLSALFLGFNPVLKIVMMILQDFGPQIASAFSEVASMAVPLLNLLGQTLGELAAAVIPMVMNVLSTLIPIFIQLGTTIMEIVMAVLPILLDTFTQLVPIVMSLAQMVMNLVMQFLPLVSVIIDALLPVFTLLIDTILNIVTAIAPALIAVIGAVISIFEAVIPVVVSILTVVVNVMANIIAAITPIIAFVAQVITTIISIIAPIITFIANVIATIFNIITPIISFVTGVFNTVFNIISGTFRSITNVISSGISLVSGIISRLSGTVSSVFNSIWNTISKIMNRVSNRIQSVFTAITNSWNGLKAFVSGVFTGIGNSMQQLVNRVKGFVNGVIGGVNTAIGLINKIPGVNISKIPQLYRGTDDWQGGFAYMNEGGRGELVMLPSGSQVIPHDVSMRYAREAAREKHRSTTVSNPASMFVDTRRIESLLEKIANSEGIVVLDSGELVGKTYHRYDRFGGNHTRLQERWD